jgi:hypothetical protein
MTIKSVLIASLRTLASTLLFFAAISSGAGTPYNNTVYFAYGFAEVCKPADEVATEPA